MFGYFPLSFSTEERADLNELPIQIDDVPLVQNIHLFLNFKLTSTRKSEILD